MYLPRWDLNALGSATIDVLSSACSNPLDLREAFSESAVGFGFKTAYYRHEGALSQEEFTPEQANINGKAMGISSLPMPLDTSIT